MFGRKKNNNQNQGKGDYVNRIHQLDQGIREKTEEAAALQEQIESLESDLENLTREQLLLLAQLKAERML